MILTAAFIQRPRDGVETHGLAGGHSSSVIIAHQLPFASVKICQHHRSD